MIITHDSLEVQKKYYLNAEEQLLNKMLQSLPFDIVRSIAFTTDHIPHIIYKFKTSYDMQFAGMSLRTHQIKIPESVRFVHTKE